MNFSTSPNLSDSNSNIEIENQQTQIQQFQEYYQCSNCLIKTNLTHIFKCNHILCSFCIHNSITNNQISMNHKVNYQQQIQANKNDLSQLVLIECPLCQNIDHILSSLLQNFRLLDNTSYNQQSNISITSKHLDQYFQNPNNSILFCLNCKNQCFTLQDFLNGNHQSHNVKTLDKAQILINQNLQSLLKKIQSKIDQSYNQNQKMINFKKKMSDTFAQNQKKIKLSFQNLINIIKNKQKQVLDQYQSLFVADFQNIQLQIQKNKEFISQSKFYEDLIKYNIFSKYQTDSSLGSTLKLEPNLHKIKEQSQNSYSQENSQDQHRLEIQFEYQRRREKAIRKPMEQALRSANFYIQYFNHMNHYINNEQLSLKKLRQNIQQNNASPSMVANRQHEKYFLNFESLKKIRQQVKISEILMKIQTPKKKPKKIQEVQVQVDEDQSYFERKKKQIFEKRRSPQLNRSNLIERQNQRHLQKYNQTEIQNQCYNMKDLQQNQQISFRNMNVIDRKLQNLRRVLNLNSNNFKNEQQSSYKQCRQYNYIRRLNKI